MRSEFIRIYKSVHTWTGIVAGMALFIAFYAGAMTVFKDPIARWMSPPRSEAMLPLDQAQTLIVETLRAHPEAAKDFTIYLHDSEKTPGRLGWQVRDPKADEHDESSVRHFAATLDMQGAAQVEEVEPSALPGFIDTLHRVVGLWEDSDENRWVMGVIAVLYALALISGLIVLLPSLIKDFFALRVGKNLKRMWLDAHNVVGIISLPFHLVMAITAVVFAFHDQFYIVQDHLIHDGKWATQGARAPGAGAAEPRNPADMLAPMAIIEKVRAQAPGLTPTMLQYQKVLSPRPVVRVWGWDDTSVMMRARGGFVPIDPYSGKVLSQDYTPGQQSTPNLWVASFFALHMAAFGGSIVHWLYFLLGLAGAWLFYSGNLLWVESRRRKARKDDDVAPVQRRDTRLMASATVGVCLGSICGISLMLVAAKLLSPFIENINDWFKPLYYTTFFASIAWAFWRGGARASVRLLWAATAFTLAIPLSTVLAIIAPSIGWWAHGSAATLGVDAVALVMAGCFAWMARATARRVWHGPTDSVWSAHSG